MSLCHLPSFELAIPRGSTVFIFKRRALVCSLATIAAALLPTQARAQSLLASPPAPTVVAQGEVTADDVYVRSGPSLNHYTVSKLKAGDRVQIITENPEWLEILPPEGTFSLISGDYVDSADGQSGVVNGQNVRVRAGSLLNDNKYTVQTMVSKGAAVTILGKNPDGFYKIKPPTGATLWISRQFVEVVPDGMAKLERETTKPLDATGETATPTTAAPSTDAAMKTTTVTEKIGSSESSFSASKSASRNTSDDKMTKGVVSVSVGALDVKSSAFDGIEMTDQRRELDAIDAATREQMAKPLLERRLQPILARYEKIAAQNEDEMARRYAQRRVVQVTEMMALVDSVRKMRLVNEDAESTRRGFIEARSKIAEPIPALPAGLDAQGELRESAIYPASRVPRRLRLVDPEGPDGRTIGYVEIPSDFHQPLELYLNRYVGIRAAARTWQEGGNDPIPVYVVGELVPLDPVKQAEEREATESANPGDRTLEPVRSVPSGDGEKD